MFTTSTASLYTADIPTIPNAPDFEKRRDAILADFRERRPGFVERHFPGGIKNEHEIGKLFHIEWFEHPENPKH